MNAYPLGNDLIVKWNLLYSDDSIFPLMNYDFKLSYRTNRGTKVVTDLTVVTVEENLLTWRFTGDQQVVSGRYTLCLEIMLHGSKVIELQYDNAFALSPIAHKMGVDSEVNITSYCDAIDIKDAVLQSRHSLDLAAEAARKSSNALANSEVAKTTSEEAKALAETSKGNSDEALEKASTAETSAGNAEQSARNAEGYLNQLNQAIAQLPDGQAVSAKVAEHTTKISKLEASVRYDSGQIDIELTWTDNQYVNGSYNVGTAIKIETNNSNCRLAKVDVSEFVGQNLIVKCYNSTTYNSYVASAIADTSNKMLYKFYQYVNGAADELVLEIPEGAKWLYLSNDKRISDIPYLRHNDYEYVNDGIVRLSTEVNNTKEELIERTTIELTEDVINSIEWTDGSIVDGSKNVGASVNIVAGFSSYRMGKLDISEYAGKTLAISCMNGVSDNYSVANDIADADNKILVRFRQYVNGAADDFKYVVAPNAKWLYVSHRKDTLVEPYVKTDIDKDLNVDYKETRSKFSQIEPIRKEVDIITSRNQWQGKKIVWMGTSIPWGQNGAMTGTNRVEYPYPSQVCDRLGAKLVDSTRGGMAITAINNGGTWQPKTYGSMSLTIAESGTAYFSAVSFENFMLNKDADLYVFDTEPNNGSDGGIELLEQFDFANWRYTDNSAFSEHRDTYVGAMLFLLDKLWAEKPSAKVVFNGEYGRLENNHWKEPYTIRTANVALAEKLSVHYINLFDKMFYNKQNLSEYMGDDRVHPKQAGYDRMADILTNELLLIS